VWYRFIGRKKLALSDKETMRLRLREFKHLYQLYKDDFDLELLIKLRHTTYKQLFGVDEEEEWVGVVLEE
jgi:hypothetical protein